MFEPGDVVVCVDDAPARNPKEANTGSAALRRGNLYNVAEVFEPTRQDGSPSPFPFAVILSNPETHWIAYTGRMGGWNADRFRRVYRPDGSLISKLLEPVDLEVRA